MCAHTRARVLNVDALVVDSEDIFRGAFGSCGAPIAGAWRCGCGCRAPHGGARAVRAPIVEVPAGVMAATTRALGCAPGVALPAARALGRAPPARCVPARRGRARAAAPRATARLAGGTAGDHDGAAGELAEAAALVAGERAEGEQGEAVLAGSDVGNDGEDETMLARAVAHLQSLKMGATHKEVFADPAQAAQDAFGGGILLLTVACATAAIGQALAAALARRAAAAAAAAAPLQAAAAMVEPRTDVAVALPTLDPSSAAARRAARRAALEKRPPTLGERATYAAQQLLRAGIGSRILMLLLLSLGAVVVGGVAYWRVSADTGMSLNAAIFKAYALQTAGGFEGETSALKLTIVKLLSLSGIFTFSILVGFVSAGASMAVSAVKEGNLNVVEEDHTVVLGFQRGLIPMLVRQIHVATNGGADSPLREAPVRGTVVILSAMPKEDVEAALQAEGVATDENVVIRKGRPWSVADLENLASLSSAARVIVLEPDGVGGDDDDEDSTPQAALMAATVLSAAKVLSTNCDNRCSVLIQRSSAMVTLAARRMLEGTGSNVTVSIVDARRDLARVLARACLQPGVAPIFAQLMLQTPDTCEIYIEPVPDRFVGRPFGETVAAFEGADVIGLIQGLVDDAEDSSSEEVGSSDETDVDCSDSEGTIESSPQVWAADRGIVRLGPGARASLALEADDKLVVVSGSKTLVPYDITRADVQQATADASATTAAAGADGAGSSGPATGDGDGSVSDVSAQDLPDLDALEQVALPTFVPPTSRPQKIALLGWDDGTCVPLARALVGILPPGSEISVLSAAEGARMRVIAMDAESKAMRGLPSTAGRNSKGRTPAKGGTDGPDCASQGAAPSEENTRDSSDDSLPVPDTEQGVTLTFVDGTITDARGISKVGAADADCVVVLADAASDPTGAASALASEAGSGDARLMASLLLLEEQVHNRAMSAERKGAPYTPPRVIGLASEPESIELVNNFSATAASTNGTPAPAKSEERDAAASALDTAEDALPWVELMLPSELTAGGIWQTVSEEGYGAVGKELLAVGGAEVLLVPAARLLEVSEGGAHADTPVRYLEVLRRARAFGYAAFGYVPEGCVPHLVPRKGSSRVYAQGDSIVCIGLSPSARAGAEALLNEVLFSNSERANLVRRSAGARRRGRALSLVSPEQEASLRAMLRPRLFEPGDRLCRRALSSKDPEAVLFVVRGKVQVRRGRRGQAELVADAPCVLAGRELRRARALASCEAFVLTQSSLAVALDGARSPSVESLLGCFERASVGARRALARS